MILYECERTPCHSLLHARYQLITHCCVARGLLSRILCKESSLTTSNFNFKIEDRISANQQHRTGQDRTVHVFLWFLHLSNWATTIWIISWYYLQWIELDRWTHTHTMAGWQAHQSCLIAGSKNRPQRTGDCESLVWSLMINLKCPSLVPLMIAFVRIN